MAGGNTGRNQGIFINNQKLKIMYKKRPPNKSSINTTMLDAGEPIEAKIRRIMKNGEPIKDKAPIVYTERKDGVMPEYDIRTDKWEIACDAKTRIADGYLKKREMEQEKRDELGRKAAEGIVKEGGTPEPGAN